MTIFDNAALNHAGLNLQAVFNLDALPPDIVAGLRACCDPAHCYRQLILIGHAGKTLWASLKASGIASEDPVDDFSVKTVEQWFAEQFAGNRCAVIYPGDDAPDLQRLGQLAGWHCPSPLGIGINEDWGTWFAYRVVVLSDTDLEPSARKESASPCNRCVEKACIVSCPGDALESGALELGKCISYRTQPQSSCRASCLARVSCPVGTVHRYCDEQIRHTYSRSMKAIEQRYS